MAERYWDADWGTVWCGIHALRYEPQGQRQRFEPVGQQSADSWHKHLQLQLQLSFPMRQGRFSPLSVSRILRIFAALAGATAIAAWFGWVVEEGGPSTLLSTIASITIFASLVLAWAAAVLGGLLLLDSAWRSSPRVRFLLVVPFMLPLIWLSFLTLVNPWSSTILGVFNQIPPGSNIGAFMLGLLVFPLIGVIVFHRAFRKAELSSTALRFASRLSFVVVGAMVLLLLGGFLFCLALVLIAASTWSVLLPPLLWMCLAVLVALSALLWRPRSRERAGTPERRFSL